MAFASSSPSPSDQHDTQGEPPFAPAPGASARQELRDEGIQWEGQVLITGTGSGIPALLVLTGDRLVLFCDGQLALDVPRLWLTPEPKLLNTNIVRLSMTPLGVPGNAAGSDQLTLAIRDGRGSAARLVTAISGRLVPGRAGHLAPEQRDAAWGATGIGASVVLPPLPDFPEPASPSRNAWPPVEHHGVAPLPAAGSGSAGPATAWTSNGKPPANATAPQASVPPDVTDQNRQFNRGVVWGLRMLILALLVGTATYFGRDSLPANFAIPLPAQLEDRLGLEDDDGNPTDVSQVPGTSNELGASGATEEPEPARPGSDGTSGAPNSDLIGGRDNSDDAGGSGEVAPTSIGNGMLDNPPATAPPTQASEPEPTQEPVVAGPTQEPVAPEPTREPAAPEPTDVPATEAPQPTSEPTETPVTPEATAEPTQEPVEEPTAVPATETPAEEPTAIPTEEPAPTEAPTGEPAATEAPTEEPAPTEIATEAPSPTATIESQPPSVDAGSEPNQSLATGGIRYTITGASRGESIPELPQINPVGGYGEWLVLEMHGENWSDTEQVFDMREFKLIADGEEFLLDVGNSWVGGLLGFTPAYGNTDAILWAGGESHPFALTFLVPVGAQDLTLVAGDQVIDLTPVVDSTGALGSAAASPELPVAIEATVVDVIDGETIVIERDGAYQTVRYVGIDVPTGDDCYASESTAANAGLVAGQTVRLERQSTDTDARGNWVRDVWVQNDDGQYVLVSEALVSSGAATASISAPNTRFAAWLNGAEANASAGGRGLWSACGEQESEGGSLMLAVTSPEIRPTASWPAMRES